MLEDDDPSICQRVTKALLAGFVPEKNQELSEVFASVSQAKTLFAVVEGYREQRFALTARFESSQAIAD